MRHRRKGNRGEGIKRLLKQLDLTSEQSSQIKAIKDQAKAKGQGLREQMRAEQEKLKSLFKSDASTEILAQQHQKPQNLRQQMGDNRFATILQIREILTPEQRAKMSELISQKSGRKAHRRHAS